MRDLSAETRAAHLEAMADRPLDVLVVGGGATGAGVALDAASRGLAVGLVEREDFASGASGRSSRLIHGGARYLLHGDVGVVYESLRERRTLLRLAPHLVRRLPFVTPTPRLRDRLYVGLGLFLYDLLATGRGIGRHRRLAEDEVSRLVPGLARPSGGSLSYDCVTDDARLTLEVVRRAAAFGALVANHAEAVEVRGGGRERGARVVDRLSGGSVDVRARMVVNAAGVWAGRVLALAEPREAPVLRPSKGVHLVLERARVPVRAAVLMPSLAGGGAMVFAIPWGARVIAGTTDTPYEGDLDAPPVEADDVRVVLGSVDRAFDTGLTGSDVVASWAGVRPLLDTGRGSTRDLSRRHVVIEDPAGVVTVTGGKLTAYRAMAREVVDLVCGRIRRGGRCRTHRIPIGLTRPLAAERPRAEAEAVELGMAPEAGRRLVERYGDEWEWASELIREDPSLGEEAVPGLPVLGVELELARIREMAITEEDVLVRRTRLTTMDAAAAAALSDSRPSRSP